MAQLDDVKQQVMVVQVDIQALIDRLDDEDAPESAEILALAQGIQDKVNRIADDLDRPPILQA